MARIAAGFGSDAVTASALSLPAGCLKFFAPAMNVEMWRQPVVQQNVARLEQLGWQRVGPNVGELACGMTGDGRMAEPAQLVEAVESCLTSASSDLTGKRVLILSGPTCEHIDPIRFVSNASSGKMGKALAEQAAYQGANVTFVTGPVPEANLPRLAAIHVEKVVSADNLLRAGRHHFPNNDIIVYAAAVADYRPANFTSEKMPKQSGSVTLTLEATPDVAATLNSEKRANQIAVGFALQTHDGEKRAVEKMKAKKFDGIVLNAPDALGGDDGNYTFFDAADSQPLAWGKLSKPDCAKRIYRFVTQKFS
jgi:phosphopantothenoylcysteine decarboxylase/phosphopantothenate--cysteine ligase